MMPPVEPTGPSLLALPGEIAVVYCPDTFVFAPGNPMRDGCCLVCREIIGHRPTAIIGAAVLDGTACRCGGIVSDTFLVHAAHLPMEHAALQAAISRGLQCGAL